MLGLLCKSSSLGAWSNNPQSCSLALWLVSEVWFLGDVGRLQLRCRLGKQTGRWAKQSSPKAPGAGGFGA